MRFYFGPGRLGQRTFTTFLLWFRLPGWRGKTFGW